jgi:glycosyltransferase involved in cell wall biosynthesis
VGKISVITVVYNDPEGLETTIKSVSSQSFKDIDYVVIDGGSGSETQCVLARYSDCISKLVSEPDNGIYNAMNKGIDICTGEWMIFMNAGDQFYDEKVLQNITPLLDDRQVDIVFGKSISHYKDLSVMRYENFSSDQPDFYKSRLPNHQAVFLSKNKYSDFRYDESYRYCADSDYLFKAFGKGVSREYHGVVSLFELGGASNYYPDFNAFRIIAIESMRLRGGVKSVLAHTVKYLLQRIMGKERYLKFYIKKGVSR